MPVSPLQKALERARAAIAASGRPDVLGARQEMGGRPLEAILDGIDAAITVRAADGHTVYANRAAVQLLRFSSVDAVVAAAPGSVMSHFDVYNEAGDRLSLDELPDTRLLHGELDPPPMTVRNVVKTTGDERWLLQKVRPVTDSDGHVLMSVSLIEDVTAIKRNEIALRLLARTAREAAEATSLSRVFQAIADEAVPDLADWAGVDVVDARGRIVTVALVHRDPDKVRLGWRLRRDWPVDPREERGLVRVIRTGEPALVADISDDMLAAAARDPEHLAVLRAVGLNSTMIAPIRAGDRVLGAVSFASSTSRRFDHHDVELACDIGSQLGVMIHNEQLHAEQAHIARTLQAGLVPQTLPAVDGWEVSSAYRAAREGQDVGGDFYDIVRHAGGAAAIVGDVLGKGAEAAALTALARHTLVAIVESSGDIPQALRVLNHRLRERGDDFRSLCTVAVVAVSAESEVTVYSAGHPQPLVAGPSGVRAVGATSPMLGFVDDLDVQGSVVSVAAGEQIVMYTDGVLDAVGAGGRFGEEGLNDAVRHRLGAGGPAAAADLLAAIDRFAAGAQSDDIAILTLTRAAVAAPAAA